MLINPQVIEVIYRLEWMVLLLAVVLRGIYQIIANGLVMVFEASSSPNRELHTFQISIFKSLPLHAYIPANTFEPYVNLIDSNELLFCTISKKEHTQASRPAYK